MVARTIYAFSVAKRITACVAGVGAMMNCER